MPSSSQRYPLATPDGKAIPLDTIRPLGFYLLDFTTGVASSITIPSNIEILSIQSTEDCVISFSGTANVPSSGVLLADSFYLSSDMRVSISPLSVNLSVIGAGNDGVLLVQLIDNWAGLSLAVQTNRR